MPGRSIFSASTVPGLEGLFAELGEKPFRASQILKWIHDRGVTDFDTMTDLSKALRGKLAEISEIRVPTATLDQESTTVPTSGCCNSTAAMPSRPC